MDWERCLRVAKHLRYWGGIHAEDGEDFVQDALLEMMERASRNGGLSTKEIWRAARCVRNRYWRAYDRGKRMVSLNARINGTGPELWETIPDKTIDLAAWADARAEILKCLIRFQRKMGKTRSLVPILGERCKELRERQGWTREKLALRSHVPYSSIFYYETGRSKLARSDCLERLARALGVTVDYLTGIGT